MTNKLELNWKLDGFVDEQRYYCSETPIDTENLPVPKVVLAGDVRTYIDTAVEVGKTYYVAVGSVKNGVEKLSDEIAVLTESWNPASIAKTPKIYLDDKLMTSQVWGSNTNADYSFSKPTSVAAPTIVQSAINGLPILRFDNNKALISDITKTSNFAKSAKVVYVFAVSKLRAINANYRRLFSVTGSQNNPSYARFSLLNGNAGGNQIWAQVGASNNAEYTISAAATNNFEAVLLKADFEAGNLKLYKNNALIATTALPTSATTATPAQTHAMSIGALFNGSYLQFTDADIACIVANDNDLTDTEIESLFEWASGKYGI